MALTQSLFRREAIEFQRGQREFGDIALLQPVSAKILGWMLTAVVAVAIVFLCFAQFSRKQTVAGYLTPAAGTLKVFPQREGVIQALYVRQGQEVNGGDPLFTVQTAEIAANGEDVNAAKLKALRGEKATLQDQITAERGNAASQRTHLQAVIAGTQSEISDLQAQLAIQQHRIEIAQTLVAAAHDLLSKGYMSVVESKRREDALLEQQQTLASLRRQIADKQNSLSEAQSTLRELPVATGRKVQPLSDQIAEAEQQIAEFNGRSSYVVRAPGAGRVSMLQVSEGQAVKPQQLDLEIVPKDSPLRAELLIPTRAAGFVRPGQQVRLRYDAFPYQNYGTYGGEIEQVSHTVLTHEELTGPIDPKEPVYSAIVLLDHSAARADGREAPLQAGMQLKAEIILDRRPLAGWIVDSLFHKRA